MAKSARDVPPPLELMCLSALWTLEEGNVRQVRQVVAQSRPLAYTTIMTVLERLVRKGKITRRKMGRAFVYSPQASRDAMRRLAVQELLERFFDGSAEELIAFLRQAPHEEEPASATPALEEQRIDTVLL